MNKSSEPDIDAVQSLWVDLSPQAPDFDAYAPFGSADSHFDVAIIGGGFTGVSTAYHMSRRFPERRIVLLEAKKLANGASGRNGGMMLNWINGVEADDPEVAQRVYGVTREGIDGIEALIREHKLPVGYRRDGCLEVYTNPKLAEKAQKRTEKLASWGLPLVFLEPSQLRKMLCAEGAEGAVLDPTAGQLNGVDLIRALAPLLVAQGVIIHEQTPVLSIEEGKTIRLTTPGGDLTAQAIVLATNAYTPALGYFRSGIVPLHSHVLATEPLSAGMQEALGWRGIAGFSDDRDRIAYGSLTPAGQIVFGGGSNAAYAYLYGNRTSYPGSPASAERGFAAVHKKLTGYFPAAEKLRIAQRWTGTLGITLSRVCSMGVMGAHQNVYYALGYSGHGVTLANLAGRVLTDIYSGDDGAWRDLPFYKRPLGGIPGEPLRWIGYQLYTRLTGRSPRRA